MKIMLYQKEKERKSPSKRYKKAMERKKDFRKNNNRRKTPRIDENTRI